LLSDSLISHPHIIPLLGVGRWEDNFCLLLPFYEAGDLGRYIKTGSDLGVKLQIIQVDI
jgi:serine/threonine protein kinase